MGTTINSMQTIIAHGAEAIIYKSGNSIIKNRIPKSYRLPQLDNSLRTQRTRHEAKILEKLQQLNFPSPKIKSSDEKKGILEIEFIDGNLIKDIIEKKTAITKQIGKNIAILHQNNIIHGDLTTSNMILKNNQVYFIDFGLSFISLKQEDKAVDIHLLDRALESKHYKIYPKAFNQIIAEYKKHYKDAPRVLARFEDVKKRGRYKAKY
jgi:Kae1-associated kinase Bud32